MMASITIRNLADRVKTRLRVRAAGYGRSMEEEARLILSGAVEQEFREQFLILKGAPVRLRPPAPILTFFYFKSTNTLGCCSAMGRRAIAGP